MLPFLEVADKTAVPWSFGTVGDQVLQVGQVGVVGSWPPGPPGTES